MLHNIYIVHHYTMFDFYADPGCSTTHAALPARAQPKQWLLAMDFMRSHGPLLREGIHQWWSHCV